ncbi:DNA transformation protein [Pseudooceanicola antarcticus]|uniref:Competence protein TfoX n=1 Tax=Pseudooceanicola antarcticus TaxID=1247613 RepID=A0A285J208_9RHOB|nr:TfoX/Sxy family protein [Pseudooceanicola antarcticus]PJE29853.1 competence protein TfoX [Pseudooceanicola antarcticus]SNY54093.1 DNA transformation protein [Pseudooceanicola antarcticus]
MAVDPDFLEHVQDLFSGMGPLRMGRMFSGAAIYADEDAMFAMVSASGQIYMKSDDSTEAAYLAAGSEFFTYERKEGSREVRSLMTLPESALDDPEEALHWARLSLPPAQAAAAEKRRAKARKQARATR